MPLEMTAERDDLLTVRATDRLHRDDYDQFVPKAEAMIDQAGRIDILFIMEDFHGWDLGGAWADLKFDARHRNDFRRVAMVGDKAWESWMTTLAKPFTSAAIRYFDRSELEEARRWVGATEQP